MRNGLGNLRRFAERDSVMTVLEGLWDRLSPYERAVVQSFRAQADGEREQVLVALRRAVQLAPGSPSVTNLAANANPMNRPREARDVLLTVDPERGRLRDWVPYWFHLANSFLMLGEYEQALEAAQRCRQLHPGIVRCLAYQAFALAAVGRVPELTDVLDEIEAMPGVSRQSWALVDVVDFLLFHGRQDVARDVADRAVTWLEARPTVEAATLSQRHEYGRALLFAGRSEEAQRVFDAIVAEFPGDIDNRTHRAFVAARRGNSALALSDADSLEWQAELLEGRQRDQARWWCRGVIYGALGDRERAMELFRQFEPQWYHGPWDHVRAIYEPMSDYPPLQELMRPKG
jgi:tetratricopeptide (TPR) repeat protein